MADETTQPTGNSDAGDAPLVRRGRRGYVVPVLLGLLVVSVYLNVFSGPVAPPPGWGDDLAVAVATAKKTNKPVVVAFYADG